MVTDVAQWELMSVEVEMGWGLIVFLFIFLLCGQSKGPHQSHPTDFPPQAFLCLFSSVYVSPTQCNQQDMSREEDR